MPLCSPGNTSVIASHHSAAGRADVHRVGVCRVNGEGSAAASDVGWADQLPGGSRTGRSGGLHDGTLADQAACTLASRIG